MPNGFNYRCPKCGSPDEMEICAFVSVRLTSSGRAEIIADVTSIDGRFWTSDDLAGCNACQFEGIVEDFEPPTGARVIELFPRQTSRK